MASKGNGVAVGLPATVCAPTNIAVVKYWGKRPSGKDGIDPALNLPLNSSLSVTLNTDHLCTVTSAAFLTNGDESDRLWLNGDEVDVSTSKRVKRVIDAFRERAKGRKVADFPLRVVSANTFPTAAGLASSASGYAGLVRALMELYEIGPEAYPGEFSAIARQGSGSASRSLDGGFVAWEAGTKTDGTDSVARQVAPHTHWPELQVVVCVVSDHKKDTSSTSGMNRSVETSALLSHRAAEIVPERMKQMETAILNRDFGAFAELTMRDSNQFHATCLDTYPPIFYMNDVSRAIIGLVHRLNAGAASPQFAYTFDAGPNAVLFCLDDNVDALIDAVVREFGPTAQSAESTFPFVRGITQRDAASCETDNNAAHCGAVSYVFHTNVGAGARPLEKGDSKAGIAQINRATGTPE